MYQKQTWQQADAKLKKAAIIEILNRPSGECLEKAAKRISKSYNGRKLPDGKCLRLSADSLKRFWRIWKKNPSDAVFDLNYTPVNLSVIRPWISFLITEYAIASGLNIPQAYQRLKATDQDLPFASRTLRRHLSDADQKRIAKAVQLHKRQTALNKEKAALTTGGNT